MGVFKILATLLTVNLVFSYTVMWKEKTIEVKVPKNSVVTIELPCRVLSAFTNGLVKAKPKGNAVFVSVLEEPTSVGVSCKKGDIYRNYSFYFFPSRSGIVFLKVLDPKLERAYAIEKMREEVEVKDGVSVVEKAEAVLKVVLNGKVPRGYEVLKLDKEERKEGFRIKYEILYSGRKFSVIVAKVFNDSYMQKYIKSDYFMGKGVVLVYLSREGWLRPKEGVDLVIVKLKGKRRKVQEGWVIPFKEG